MNIKPIIQQIQVLESCSRDTAIMKVADIMGRGHSTVNRWYYNAIPNDALELLRYKLADSGYATVIFYNEQDRERGV